MIRWLTLICLLATACDDTGGGAASDAAHPDASSQDAALDAGPVDAGEADAVVLEQAHTAHVINIVDPAAVQAVRGFLQTSPNADIAGAARAVYEVLPDDYDFLYIFAPTEVPDAASGRYVRVRSPAMPAIGLDAAADDPSFGSPARLKGAVALNPNAVGNGPTIHETLHHWGVFLDRSLGFGRDRDTEFGAHWGTAGVNGQHGGFVTGAVRCAEPADSEPPCAPGADGRAVYVLPAFGPNANGGDGTAYALIELYLMGLVPASEVPDFDLLVEASFIEFDEATNTFRMSADDLVTRTMDDIVAIHGERPPAEQSDFRAAFVVVSDAPLDEAALAPFDQWARIFGGVTDSPFLESFEGATGGRATMDVRLFTP